MSLKLYGTAHRLVECTSWTFLVALLTSLSGGRYVELPAISTSITLPIAAPMLIAFAIGPAIVTSFQSPVLRLEALSQRNLHLTDLLLLLAVALPTLAVAAGALFVVEPEVSMHVIRDVCFLGALTIAFSTFTSATFAAATPALYVILAATLGSGSGYSAQWWAFLRTDPETGHVIFAVTAIVLSWAVHTMYARKISVRIRVGGGETP